MRNHQLNFTSSVSEKTKSEFIIIKTAASPRQRLSERNEMRHIAILNELQNIKLNGRPEKIEVNVSRARYRVEREETESRVI